MDTLTDETFGPNKDEAITKQVADETYDALAEMVRIDPLTGLHNRRYLENNVLRKIKKEKTPFAVIMLDLDHFKEVNDTYEHATGDNVLREVGLVIRENIRPGDVAIRYGGEEFTIFLFDQDRTLTPKILKDRAEKIRTAIEKKPVKRADRQSFGSSNIAPGDRIIYVTASVGATIWDGKEDPLVTVGIADALSYIAKQTGRNRVIVKGFETQANE